MRGRGIGVVVASRHPDFRAGELYDASLGWQDFSIQRPHDPDSIFSLRRVEDPVPHRPPHALSLEPVPFDVVQVAAMAEGDQVGR